jgi:serine/threonine-protein kinase
LALTPGTRLGPYEIVALLGSGGMGEVYRARDTKLGRDVAIKILPEAFAHDADRLARFTREAKTLAALNHPHIAGIYGLEGSDGVSALVMELVEGEDLSQRIARGAIPLDEALPIAKQIAEALEAAHEQGIIHRDLKPANIKVRSDGTVKVLDFGLARATEPAGAASASASMSPTLSLHTTQAGMILGTAAYMSPEQAAGKIVDKRTDVWSFGVVLMEMLTGRRVFPGETVAHVLAAVMATEPDWATTPPRVRTLIQRCLRKDPRQRLHDIADARIELDETGRPEHDTIPSIRATRRERLAWILVVGLCLAVALLFWIWRRPVAPTTTQPLVRFDLDLGRRSPAPNSGANVALSSDGTRMAFATTGSGGATHLVVRRLDQAATVELSDTEGASAPFFSPDGQAVGFFAGGKLKKVSVDGGAVTTLCDAPNARGASWGQDGSIIVATDVQTPLFRLPASGGYTPIAFTKLTGGEISHRWPQVLPGGKALLFTALTSANFAAFDEASIEVMPIPLGVPKTVYQGGSYGRYLASGHLVYVRNGTMFAVPFDLDRLAVRDRPVPVLDSVAYVPSGGAAQFDVSTTGAMVYERGLIPRQTIGWLDRSGHVDPLLNNPGAYTWPRLSPDGHRLVYRLSEGPRTDLWIYDGQRGTNTRLTTDPVIHNSPTWSADGRYIAYQAAGGVFWIAAEGGARPRRLSEATNTPYPESFSADGRWLALSIPNPATGDLDIWTAPLRGSGDALQVGTSQVFAHTSGNERNAAFSPDSRWLAYDSSESGTYEVYVRAFSGTSTNTGAAWQISSGGGFNPRWSQNGRELLYGVNNRIMLVTFTIRGDAFVADKPRLWSDREVYALPVMPTFDLSPTGERVAVEIPASATTRETQHRVTFVLNFFDELRRQAPLTP